MQLQDLQQETTDYCQDIERMTFRIIRCEKEIWSHHRLQESSALYDHKIA